MWFSSLQSINISLDTVVFVYTPAVFSNRVSNIIRRYIGHMKFAAYMVVPLLHRFIFFWFHFVSLHIWLYILYTYV